MGAQNDHRRGTGPVESLRNEFREHLDVFYSRLKLAAPYDSVEKALGALTTRLTTLPPEALQELTTDATRRWACFRQAFVESGLSSKHRGIIAGLARSGAALNLPPEYEHLLDLYRSTR